MLEVAHHGIGGADVVLLVAAVVEVVDPAVLQETADHADDPHVIRQPRDPGSQAASVAHNEIHSHARLGGKVQLARNVGVFQGIDL